MGVGLYYCFNAINQSITSETKGVGLTSGMWTQDGGLPLHDACGQGHAEVARVLLGAGDAAAQLAARCAAGACIQGLRGRHSR